LEQRDLMAEMVEQQLNAFLNEARIAKLATLNADGSPTIVPVWFEWDGRVARVFSAENLKVRNIRADARVALTVEEGVGVPEACVTIEGEASLTREGAFALAERLTPRYYPPERVAPTLADWGKMADRWWLITITPKRIRSLAP
jgi:PPOX class probable F420-dependent enzyme